MANAHYNQGLLKVKENGVDHSDNKSKATPIAMVAPEMKQKTDYSEITKTCAVSGCEDYKHLGPESFFRFPEEPGTRQIWADLTGRPDWTPTDYSYICFEHFSVDSFRCTEDGDIELLEKAVPSAKLPTHVLEVEYIDEETLENDGFENGDNDMDFEDEEEQPTVNATQDTITNPLDTITNPLDNIELLKLYTEVQKMQRQAVGLKDKLRCNMKLHHQQSRYLQRLHESIKIKQKILSQKKKRKSRILLSIQDKVKEDANGLVLAMPLRYSDDSKNFALSIYKYSPQSYIYARNMLRTMLPSTDILESWLKAGFQPKNLMTNCNLIKVIAEQTESELSCKVTLH